MSAVNATLHGVGSAAQPALDALSSAYETVLDHIMQTLKVIGAVLADAIDSMYVSSSLLLLTEAVNIITAVVSGPASGQPLEQAVEFCITHFALPPGGLLCQLGGFGLK